MVQTRRSRRLRKRKSEESEHEEEEAEEEEEEEEQVHEEEEQGKVTQSKRRRTSARAGAGAAADVLSPREKRARQREAALRERREGQAERAAIAAVEEEEGGEDGGGEEGDGGEEEQEEERPAAQKRKRGPARAENTGVKRSKLEASEDDEGSDNEDSGDEDSGDEDSDDEDSDSSSSNDKPAAALVASSPPRSPSAAPHVITTYNYFKQHAGVSRTSNNTLADLDLPTEKERRAILRRLAVQNAEAKAMLVEFFRNEFRDYFVQLRGGFNLLFYGLGSKKALINQFAKEWFSDGPVVVVNGYFPALSLKQVLGKIAQDVLQTDAVSGNKTVSEQVAFIRRMMLTPDCIVKHLYVVVHNIDGAVLRNHEAQAALSELAAVPGIHLVASIDHILSPLLWDFERLARFRFQWMHVPTFAAYKRETMYEDPVLGGNKESRSRGIKFVLQSLTPNHRDILTVLARRQVDDASYEGMTFADYLVACQEGMLVSTDVALRAHLSEMIDHHLVALVRRGGRELYRIPYPEEIVRKHILGEVDAVDASADP